MAKVTQLTEGKVSKGGQNPPNTSSERPPKPGGSGGKARRCPMCEKPLTERQMVCSEECYESMLIAEEQGPQ